MSKTKILSNAGSLSENDMALLTGTDIIVQMIRNRIIIVNEPKEEVDWLDLTENLLGLYHIRSIDGKRLYQIWFENASDIDMFKKNFMLAKLSDTTHSDNIEIK
ncbi:hypothetical protein N8072_01165 [bacterium]|jgi:hypothetical protein|nr:hypothetical protein [bacterium]MDC1257271.1 hypothetical protein [bacterium]